MSLRVVHFVWLKIQKKYYRTWESSTILYLPLALGEPHWADLTRWVAAGQLYWVDASDPELNIKTHDVAAFPYKGLSD